MRKESTRNASVRARGATFLIAAALASLIAAGPAASQSGAEAPNPGMEITRNELRSSVRGSAQTFTGAVRIDALFDAGAGAETSAALVTFEPGARTAWHSHPRGQRLIVISGLGRTQVEGGPVEVIGPGDVVWCPPGLRHWHGAAPQSAMSHIAVQEAVNGSPVNWMEHVTDEQYDSSAADNLPHR